MQPLDVGIFQSYKHWHNVMVMNAINHCSPAKDLDVFLGDLQKIREKALTENTITSAFKKCGIWPADKGERVLAAIACYTSQCVPKQPELPPMQLFTPRSLSIQGDFTKDRAYNAAE